MATRPPRLPQVHGAPFPQPGWSPRSDGLLQWARAGTGCIPRDSGVCMIGGRAYTPCVTSDTSHRIVHGCDPLCRRALPFGPGRLHRSTAQVPLHLVCPAGTSSALLPRFTDGGARPDKCRSDRASLGSSATDNLDPAVLGEASCLPTSGARLAPTLTTSAARGCSAWALAFAPVQRRGGITGSLPPTVPSCLPSLPCSISLWFRDLTVQLNGSSVKSCRRRPSEGKNSCCSTQFAD